MSMLTIEMTPELEQRLEEEAVRSGRSVAEVALVALHKELLPPADAPGLRGTVSALFEGLPHRTLSDLQALADAQGVRPVARPEELRGDFWPEEENADQFLAWLQEGRRDRQSRPGE
jgi:hypothetical protein